MNPGDELRIERARERCGEAGKLLRRAAHMHAASAVLGICAAALIGWRADIEGAWMLIGAALVLNYAAGRVIERARGMM